MEKSEIERLLLQNLQATREIKEYVIKIDRRQRWARNIRAIYWIVLIGLAVLGYYYAFPYLQSAKEQMGVVWEQFTGLLSMTQPQ